MTKLKTLESIYWKRNEHPKDVLRQEVIKWIKDMKIYDNNLGLVTKLPCINTKFYDTLFEVGNLECGINILKHIFNITEKDLK